MKHKPAALKEKSVVDNILEEIVVDGLHGVLLPVWISPFPPPPPPPESHPRTEGLQSSQGVGVKSKDVRKTTTGWASASASAQGLSTATASWACLTFS